jgi:DNA polymerase zeta
VVAGQAMAQDPRAEPRFAERIPFVVVVGPPGARLVDQVGSLHDFLWIPFMIFLYDFFWARLWALVSYEK